MMRASETLAANVREELPDVARRAFSGAWAEIERLIAMAENDGVSDADFLEAVKRLHESVPDLWDRVDSSPIAEALENAMGAAMVNGAQGV